jgi:hypothetical protein
MRMALFLTTYMHHNITTYVVELHLFRWKMSSSSSAAVRIDKFAEDGSILLSISGGGSAAVAAVAQQQSPPNYRKVQSEVDRLAKWLHKHQEEVVPDGSKAKLFATIQAYYKVAISAPASEEGVRSAVHELVDALLKIPEGKLVSAKAKQSAIKWIESLRDSTGSGSSLGGKPVARRRLVVMDVASDGSLSVLQPGTSDLMQSLAISNGSEVLPRLRVLLEELGSVEVEIEGDRVVAVLEEAEGEPGV